MVSETYMSKNSHLAFRGKREVLAQELAMAANGISNPTKYSRTPVFTVGTSEDQRAAIKRDTKRILGLLKEGERKKVPELAVLYNTLIARFGSDKEYFIAPSSSGIRRTENVWGLVAVPVPSVPLDTAASKKAALVNKDSWPWSRPDDVLDERGEVIDEKPKEEPEPSLSEKAAGIVKTPSGPTQRIPTTPPDNKTFLEGEKPEILKKSDVKKREETLPNLAKEYKLEEEHLKAVETFKKVEVPKLLKALQIKNAKKVMDEVMQAMIKRDFDKAKLKYINALEEGVKSGKLKPIKAEDAVKRFEELQRQLKNKR
jgi:LysM repeat protein